MIMRKRKKKPACGKPKLRSWKSLGWAKSKFEKNNVTQNLHHLTHRRFWTRLSRLVACTKNPAKCLDSFRFCNRRDSRGALGGIKATRLGSHCVDHCYGLHRGV